jgi:phosphatidylglycerophosphate synthase
MDTLLGRWCALCPNYYALQLQLNCSGYHAVLPVRRTSSTAQQLCVSDHTSVRLQFSSPVSIHAAPRLVIRVALVCSDCDEMVVLQKSSSSFGAFLDPVADKLMVCSVLALLCTKTFSTGLFAAAPWLMHASAVAIICREVAMSSLREHAASLGPDAASVVAVNKLGKYKTALQLVSLTLLLVAMNGGQSEVVQFGATVGPWALLGAAALTWQSFIAYLVALWRFL